MKSTVRNLFTTGNDKTAAVWYNGSLLTLLLWIGSLFITIFTIPFGLFSNGYVLFSLLIRGLLIFLGLRGLKRMYIDRSSGASGYELWKHYTGYGIVLTYVFCIFPQVVRDFNKADTSPEGLGFVIGVLVTTLFAAVHYLFLTNDKTRLAVGAYDEQEIKERKTLRKDKTLQKKRRKQLKKGRSFFQNLWYEWVEPVLGAIIWVLIINHLLFQLYQIPTESMVPTFLTKDRVIVTKTQYGPTIPLTEYRLFSFSKPKTGQIVTFSSPEMDDPDSELRYKNVFTRVFQPFIYIITFTKVDIDSDEQGNPKARLLVKRVIGEPEEKLCILNDQVYKKTAGSDWRVMDEIPGEEEYGKTDLYYDENPKMRYQRINPQVRTVTDRAAGLVEAVETGALEEMLAHEKRTFLSLVSSRGAGKLAGQIETVLSLLERPNEELKSELSYYLRYFSYINTLQASQADKDGLVSLFGEILDRYPAVTFYGELRDLLFFLEREAENPGWLDENITVTIDMNYDSAGGGPDPYTAFMKKTNGYFKYSRMAFYNTLLASPSGSLEGILTQRALDYYQNEEPDFPVGLEELSALSVYTDGLERPSGGSEPDYYNFFEVMQFSPFPSGEGEYLGDGEYFLMGDNRYNSLDARLGRSTSWISLDEDDVGEFSKKVEVSWDGHVMTDRHIHGRVRAVLFPFSRIKFF